MRKNFLASIFDQAQEIRYDDWHLALAACDEKYRKYNWIHVYPNACCEVIALYYGEGDFRATLYIITMCGLDADCNAAMVMSIIAIRNGCASIPKKYIHPAFDKLTTYLRGDMREITLDSQEEKTMKTVISAVETKNKCVSLDYLHHRCEDNISAD